MHLGVGTTKRYALYLCMTIFAKISLICRRLHASDASAWVGLSLPLPQGPTLASWGRMKLPATRYSPDLLASRMAGGTDDTLVLPVVPGLLLLGPGAEVLPVMAVEGGEERDRRD